MKKKMKIDFSKSKEKLTRMFSGFSSKFDKFSTRIPTAKTIFTSLPKLKWVAWTLAGLLTADLALLALSVHNSPPPSKLLPPQKIVKMDEPWVGDFSKFENIISQNRFCPGCPVPDIKKILVERPKDCNRAKKLGAQPKLIGTVVLSEAKFSVAILSDGGESEALSIGESFKNYGKIFEITRDKVCFEGPNGKLTYAQLPDELIKFSASSVGSNQMSSPQESAAPKAEEEKTFERKFIMDALNDPSILTKALARPERDANGNLVGYKILNLEAGSVYEKLGIKVGDTVTQVDGESVTNFSKVQELWANARNLESLEITVQRGGAPVKLKFSVR